MSTGQNVLISGRIVWKSGDLFKGKAKIDFNTKQPVIKDGKGVTEYSFGLAVSKQDPALHHFMGLMQAEARSVYQSGNIPPSFSFKFKDGDGIDDKGIKFSEREGHVGCLIFALTTQQPVTWFKYENGINVVINEGVKCGDYVNVQVNMKANVPVNPMHKAGMFLNPNAVQLIGYGKEIVSNVIDATSIFGNVVPVVPQGASPVHLAPQDVPQAPQFQQQMMPQQPQAPAQPHFGVLPQVHQPQTMQPQFQQPQMPQAPTGFGNPFGTQQ